MSEQSLEQAHEILAPLRGERLEDEVYQVLERRIAEALEHAERALGEKTERIEVLESALRDAPDVTCESPEAQAWRLKHAAALTAAAGGRRE